MYDQQQNVRIHSTESFGAADGPGVRFIVFLQGCRMRCKYCHNPDTWSLDDGEEISSDDLIKRALRYKSYWKDTGGITVSGGEPLIHIDFLVDFFKKAKQHNINTVIDTSGNPFTYKEPFFSKFNELMKYTDLILLDIKEINPERHRFITGCDNKNILEMAKFLSNINKPVWIRHVLVPTLSDFDDDLKKLAVFIKKLNNVKRVEVLPYHTLGLFKWEASGIPYTLKNILPPNEKRIENAKKILLNL